MNLDDRSGATDRSATVDESTKAFAGARARRRTFSVEERVAVVWESYQPRVVVAHLARRYGIAENTIFYWRRIYGWRRIDPRIKEAARQNPVVVALMTQVKVLEDLIESQTQEEGRLRDRLAQRSGSRVSEQDS